VVEAPMSWLSRIFSRSRSSPRDVSSTSAGSDDDRLLEARWRDVRYAIRSLRRSPAFTAGVTAALALGIGANTAVFSAIDAVLLRPLPFPDGDRLVHVMQRQRTGGESHVAPVRLEEWNRLNATFVALTGYYTEDVSDTAGDLPERVRRAFVAPRFVEVWGIPPARGRAFSDREHLSGGPAAVLISHRYWQRRFGGDPGVLGRSVRIGTGAFPVIGVMPATFLFPDRGVDLWFPAAVDNRYAQSRAATWFIGVGRLKGGVSLAEARADLARVQAQLAQQFPVPDATVRVAVAPSKEPAVASVRPSLWLLFGGVSVLLLITCTNVAALLLSRASARGHETSVRLSLGASPAAIRGQILAETALLAGLGALSGIAFAAAATRALGSAIAISRGDEIAIDARVLLYTLTTTVLVVLLCGLLPAVWASRRGRADVLAHGGRTQVSTRRPFQWLLVGAQVALSVTLLACAGLLVRSIDELSRVVRGFDAAHVLTFSISGNYGETVDYERLTRRITTALDALQSLPGVISAATAMTLPGVPVQFASPFLVIEAAGHDDRLVAEARVVSPEYFTTVQIPLLRGTMCTRQPAAAERLLMVNEAFVARHLARWESPLGLHLKSPDSALPPGRIVGVVGNAREGGIDREPPPTVYSCFSAPGPTPHFLVRATGDPVLLADVVRWQVKELEPLRSVYDVAPLETRIDESFAQNRVRTLLLVFFGLTAIAIAAVGLYGTLSYSIAQRRREIGLRLAIGATRRAVVQNLVGQGVRVVAIASVVGLILAFAVAQAFAGMLYGVSRFDPLSLIAVTAAVVSVTGLALLIPALRAAWLEPMHALRDQ
jgi:putative ABC transport system permease protein